MTRSNASSPIVLVETNRLLRHEEHLADRLAHVRRRILDAGVWTAPLLVERDALVLMDGHHRLAFAREMGFDCVPCLLAEYHQVGVESRHPEFIVTPANVRKRARTGQLYPPRTTRHHVPEHWTIKCWVSLSELGFIDGRTNVLEMPVNS